MVTGSLRANRLVILNNSALVLLSSSSFGTVDVLPNCSFSGGDSVIINITQDANFQGAVVLGKFAKIRGSSVRFFNGTGRLSVSNSNNGAALDVSSAQFGGTLIIIYSSSAFGRSTVTATQTVPVASFSSSSGSFSSVSVVSAIPNPACDTVTAAQPSSSSSSLSGLVWFGFVCFFFLNHFLFQVTLSVSRDTSQPGCSVSSGGLSTGAIVGIVVGNGKLFKSVSKF